MERGSKGADIRRLVNGMATDGDGDGAGLIGLLINRAILVLLIQLRKR
jgi:hypothetical protein